jgi:hypothetical protein
VRPAPSRHAAPGTGAVRRHFTRCAGTLDEGAHYLIYRRGCRLG